MDLYTSLQGIWNQQVLAGMSHLTWALVDSSAVVVPPSVDRDKPAPADEAIPEADADAAMLHIMGGSGAPQIY